MLRRTLVTLILVMTIFSTASAEEFTIEADGYHTLSRKETILEAEEAAVNDALRWAVEQIGVRISAYSEVVNKVIKEDTVQRFASSVVKIKEKTLTPKVMNDDYRIYAHVVCVVNTDDLDRWEPPDVERQRRLEEDKKRLEAENKKLTLRATQKFATGEVYSFREQFRQAKKDNKVKEFYDNYVNAVYEKYINDCDAFELLGDIDTELGYYFDAVTSYESAFMLGAADSRVLEKYADAYLLLGTIKSMTTEFDPDKYSKFGFESAIPLYEKYIMLNPGHNDAVHKLAVCYWNLEQYDKFYNTLYSIRQKSNWYKEIDKWLTQDKKPRFNKKIHGWDYVKNGRKNNWVPTRFYEKFAEK